MNAGVAGCNKSAKEWMRSVWLAQELGVILAGHVERMVLQLNEFNQIAIGRGSTEYHPCLFELLAVRIIKLVAVTMALIDQEGAIKMRGLAANRELARL